MARFMYGRNGTDQLGMFTLTAYLLVWVVQMLTRWGVLEIVEVLLLVVLLFRMLSRNLPRRREENAKFLQATRPIQRRWTTFRSRAQDREHRYFKCPNCGQQMRVPRGKGRITVHCRNCGATFEEKS
jgi:ribosomal protein S27E